VLESIITTGTVTRGWIGVEPQDVTPEIAESFGLDRKSGAIVAGVLQGGPADKAGIKPGDILVSINDDTITDTTRLLNVVAQIKPVTIIFPSFGRFCISGRASSLKISGAQ